MLHSWQETATVAAVVVLQVAGVDNKVARYREDRQLAQRLTPFAERCAAVVWCHVNSSVNNSSSRL